MAEVLLDSLLDTLKLLPFLFLLYLLIEVLEHKTAMGRPAAILTGRAAPFFGALTGLVPMCGFSVMASKLYERKYLTIGTLLAVFVATSDEALIVLLLSELGWAEKLDTVLALCGSKLVFGAAVGYLADLVAKKTRGSALTSLGETHEEEQEPHACEHKKESGVRLYLVSPLLHALQVAAFVFLFYLAFGALFRFLGEENVVNFLQGAGLWYQPLFTSLLGLVPYCASSVLLSEVYAAGGITFSALLGGLVTNAGLGAFFLFRNRRAAGRNLLILFSTFFLGLFAGYLATPIELALIA